MRQPTTIDALLSRAMPEPNTGCYLWTGYLGRKGYGQVWHLGRMVRTHRVAWTLANGPVPDRLHVLHKCDTPACCNPSHLFLGTNADNSADKVRKGRQPRGETHPFTRLSDADVSEIRRLASLGLTRGAIGALFGVTRECARDLILGKRRLEAAECPADCCCVRCLPTAKDEAAV